MLSSDCCGTACLWQSTGREHLSHPCLLHITPPSQASSKIFFFSKHLSKDIYQHRELCQKLCNFVRSVFATKCLQQLLMQCDASAIIKAIIGWMANRYHFPLPRVLASAYLKMLTCKCLATAWFVPVFACLHFLASARMC